MGHQNNVKWYNYRHNLTVISYLNISNYEEFEFPFFNLKKKKVNNDLLIDQLISNRLILIDIYILLIYYDQLLIDYDQSSINNYFLKSNNFDNLFK